MISYYRRYWILLLLRASMYSGMGTLSSDTFHRLVYFINALMPAIGLTAETARVLKQPGGPFFPDYQRDLDRLVGISHVSVVDFSGSSEQFQGKYRISRMGISLAERIAMSSPFFSDVERGISEIVSAFAALPLTLATLATKWDANYGQDSIRDGTVVDFGEWVTANYSQEAAEYLFENWLRRRRNMTAGYDLAHGVVTQDLESFSNLNDSRTDVKWIGQSNVSSWRPLTSSHPRRRAFGLYANYLVQAIAKSVMQDNARGTNHV